MEAAWDVLGNPLAMGPARNGSAPSPEGISGIAVADPAAQLDGEAGEALLVAAACAEWDALCGQHEDIGELEEPRSLPGALAWNTGVPGAVGEGLLENKPSKSSSRGTEGYERYFERIPTPDGLYQESMGEPTEANSGGATPMAYWSQPSGATTHTVAKSPKTPVVTPTTRTTWLQQRTVSRSPMRNSLRTSTPRRTLRFAAKAAKDSRTWEGLLRDRWQPVLRPVPEAVACSADPLDAVATFFVLPHEHFRMRLDDDGERKPVKDVLSTGGVQYLSKDARDAADAGTKIPSWQLLDLGDDDEPPVISEEGSSSVQKSYEHPCSPEHVEAAVEYKPKSKPGVYAFQAGSMNGDTAWAPDSSASRIWRCTEHEDCAYHLIFSWKSSPLAARGFGSSRSGALRKSEP
jgi:hypothetical protein